MSPTTTRKRYNEIRKYTRYGGRGEWREEIRLEEREIIKKVIKEKIGDVKIYLFGSRVDDNLKGGDIDIYIDKKLSSKEKLEILAEFSLNGIERKVDLISKGSALENIAKKGVLL